jgi:hypothetical protein
MVNKEQFTAEEWSALRDTPHEVALAVAISGASGIVGSLKEAFSSSKSLVEAMKGDNELLRALCTREEIGEAQKELRAGIPQLDRTNFTAAKEQMGALALDHVREAVAILERKSPSDVASYRTFVRGLGERVANAAKEGDFLGFGGARVSEGARRTLAGRDAALAGTRS